MLVADIVDVQHLIVHNVKICNEISLCGPSLWLSNHSCYDKQVNVLQGLMFCADATVKDTKYLYLIEKAVYQL
jgi:hypothetical protein